MGTKDPRVDAYIAKAAGFAKPILKRVRAQVHATCPDATEELKWGAPHFNYKGMFVGMAAFKAHCMFHFWKGSLVVGPGGTSVLDRLHEIKSVDDLPSPEVMTAYLKKAVELNDQGVKLKRTPKAVKDPVRVPADLSAALKKNKKAQTVFADFSPSHKREYVEWIAGAKAADTRARRLTQAIEWIAEGKSRNWKYERR